MNVANDDLALLDDEVRIEDVSDESLESAAAMDATNAANYTLGSCTGFMSCPA